MSHTSLYCTGELLDLQRFTTVIQYGFHAGESASRLHLIKYFILFPGCLQRNVFLTYYGFYSCPVAGDEHAAVIFAAVLHLAL